MLISSLFLLNIFFTLSEMNISYKRELIFSKESYLMVSNLKRSYKFSLEIKEKIIIRRTITAYSIKKHLTASGRRCRKGIVAANWLPLGTKILIPKLFGNKIFVVADRMNIRYPSRLDVWMPEREALNFGVKTSEIIVLR